MDSNPRSPARETTLRDCLLIEEVRFAADLYGAFPVKRLFLGFAHSSLFGAGKAVLRPVACDQVRGGRMNSEMGLSSKLRRLTAPVCVMIRGELAIGAHLRAAHSHEGNWCQASIALPHRNLLPL